MITPALARRGNRQFADWQVAGGEQRACVSTRRLARALGRNEIAQALAAFASRRAGGRDGRGRAKLLAAAGVRLAGRAGSGARLLWASQPLPWPIARPGGPETRRSEGENASRTVDCWAFSAFRLVRRQGSRLGLRLIFRVLYPRVPRRGAGVVDRDGLENRCTFTGTVSSNLTLSASRT